MITDKILKIKTFNQQTFSSLADNNPAIGLLRVALNVPFKTESWIIGDSWEIKKISTALHKNFQNCINFYYKFPTKTTEYK